MKRKEPYPNLAWPLYIIFIAVGCLIAKVLLDVFVSRYDGIFGNVYVYDILLLVYGLFMCVFVYQLGKFIFGKIAGFDVLFFNFIFFGIKKIGGKWKAFSGLKEGLSLKVEMVPSPNKKQNVTLALFGGTILTVVAAGITNILIFVLPTTNALKGFFTLSSIFYLFSILAYMLPAKLDGMNDGFNLVLIKKYNLLDTYLKNRRNLRAMYDPNYELEFNDALLDNNDPISMEARLFNFYYALRKENKDLIIKVGEELNENYKFIIGENEEESVLVARIYMICLKGDYAELKDIFWKLDALSRRTLTSLKNLESLKVGLYISSKVDESREGLVEIVNCINKCAKGYRYNGQLASELKLINDIKEDIYKTNPELKIEAK